MHLIAFTDRHTDSGPNDDAGHRDDNLRAARRTAGAARPGMTLLEIILTMSLAVVIMGLVSGAIQMYAREMNVRGLEIRRTHLATQVMRMIEMDLIAALHPEPLDAAPLEEFLVASMGSKLNELQQGEDLSAVGLESDDPTAVDPALEANATLMTGTVLQTPGLIGSQTMIQFDISRLPRMEEYSPLLPDQMGQMVDVPSDLKTVAYMVQPPGFVGGATDPMQQLIQAASQTAGTVNASSGLDSLSSAGGLVRRVLDRAATVLAAETGGLNRLNQSGQIIASEIVGIEFSYWDGLLWTASWDSDLMGQLPLAVQITMSVGAVGDASESIGLEEDPQNREADIAVFQHIVRLPMAQPAEADELTLGTGESESDATETSGAAL